MDAPSELQPLLRPQGGTPAGEQSRRPFITTVHEFLNAEPPARSSVERWGLRFERVVIALIVVNTVTFVLASEPSLYSNSRGGYGGDAGGAGAGVGGAVGAVSGTECWTPWRWVFETVEWTTAIVFTVEYIFRLYSSGYCPDNTNAIGDGSGSGALQQRRGHVGPWRRRLSFAVSFFGLVDLASVLPFYADRLTESDLPAVQWVRLIRLFKVMQTEERFAEAFATFGDMLAEKRPLLVTSGFVGGAVWVVVSCLYYLAEKGNPSMVLRCGPDYELNRFGSVPSAAFYALANLFGEYPLMQDHSPLGMVVGTFVAVFAVALFAIPTGIVAAGFEAKVVARQAARREAASRAARERWAWAARQAVRQTRTAVVLAFQSSVPRPPPVYARLPDPVPDDDGGTAQGAVYMFVFGKTAAGEKFETAVMLLIVANVACFFAGTVPAVASTGAADEGTGPLWVVEAASVTVFTLEFAARLFGVGHDRRYAGWRGRARYLVTFEALVDAAAIVPFYVDLCLPQDFEGTTFVRALRLTRLLKGEQCQLAFSKCADVVRANRDVLTLTGFTAAVLWVFFSTFMHYAERNNPCNAYTCGGDDAGCDDVASSYRSIPASMWITLLNLSGEVPLADYTPVGKVLVGVMGVFAVGLFGIPVGVLAAGFEEWAQEASAASAKGETASSKEEGVEGETSGGAGSTARSAEALDAHARAVVNGAAGSAPGDSDAATHGGFRRAVFVYLRGGAGDGSTLSRHAERFVTLIFALIFVTVAIAVVETEPVVRDARGVSAALDWVEGAAVVVFTTEYLARLYASPEDPVLRRRVRGGPASWLGGDVGARLRFVLSFYSVVDLLAIVPWYVAQCGVGWADRSDELLRMLRLVRLVSLDRFVPSITLIDDVFHANRVILLVTAYVAGIFWLVFATMLYVTEHGNDAVETELPMSQRFGDVPSSLQYAAMFLSGDFPLVKFSFWGRVVLFFNVLVAVGVVGIPASVLASGFADLLDRQRQEASARGGGGGGAGASDRDGDGLLENRTISCCFGEGLRESAPGVRPWQRAAHRLVEGRARSGRAYQRFMLAVILLNLVAVVAESVPGVFSAAPAAWTAFETASVAFFTLDYGLRLAAASENPRCGYSRAVYATTFLGLVDLLSFAPFYVELALVAAGQISLGKDGSDAEVFRVLRVVRLFNLEHFVEAFTLLDDVYRECRPILAGTGVLALIIWVGSAVLLFLFEPDVVASVPQGLFYAAVFLGGDWAICDFSVPGKVLCVVMCVVGIALYGTCVGFLVDAFQEVLERRAERRVAASARGGGGARSVGASGTPRSSGGRTPVAVALLM